MAPNPPDPHVKKKTPLPVLLFAIIVIVAGLAFTFANHPGAGMGGSLSGAKQSPH